MNRILLSILTAFAVLLAGCKTSEPEAVAFKTLKTIQVAVDSAMEIYGVAYRAGKVSPEKREKVHSTHAKYRIAFSAAVELARFDYSALAPDDVQNLANEIAALVEEF